MWARLDNGDKVMIATVMGSLIAWWFVKGHRYIAPKGAR